MKILNRLERRFGRFAVTELTWKLIGLQVCVYVLGIFQPGFYSMLVMDPQRVLHGEVWRLVTFVLIPPIVDPRSVIWFFFYVYVFWLIGASLEREWGYFRYNLFWLVGALGTAFVAFFTPGAYVSDSYYLQLTLFLAFATIFPDFMFYIFFILPVKVKYLAFLSAAGLVVMFIKGSAADRLGIAVALGNYFLFFGPTFFTEAKVRFQTQGRRREFEANQREVLGSGAFHECAVCGRTDATHPALDFRVGADGKDYCVEHLPKQP